MHIHIYRYEKVELAKLLASSSQKNNHLKGYIAALVIVKKSFLRSGAILKTDFASWGKCRDFITHSLTNYLKKLTPQNIAVTELFNRKLLLEATIFFCVMY